MLNILGIDIGTTTISAVVVCVKNGEMLFSLTEANDSAFESSEAFRRTQSPERIKQIVFGIIDKIKNAGISYGAIGVTGQMHGILYLDKNGEPLSPLYTWQDESGLQPYKDTTYAGYLCETSGYNVASGYGMVTHFYNLVNGCVPEEADVICTIHDYIAMLLSGEKRPVMHTSNAASLGFFDLEKGGFDIKALHSCGISDDILPKVTADVVCVNSESTVSVGIAIGDNQASVIGAADLRGGALINIGTGSQISLICGMCTPPEGCELRPLYKDRFMLVGSGLCGGRSYAMLHDFFKECARLFGGNTKEVYAVMDKAAEQDPNRHELFVDTRFCGTRTDPSVRGAVQNISIDNFTPHNLTRGFIHGMAYELYELYDLMIKSVGYLPETLAGSGNAIRKSSVIRGYIQELFSLGLSVPKNKEEAAFGAAIFSAAAVGAKDSVEAAQAAMLEYL